MPANEQPWRNQKRMHLIFAISGLVLLVSTIWMFMKDHQREWKPYQIKMRQIDLIMSDWRKLQFQTEAAFGKIQSIEDELERVQGRGLDGEKLTEFKDILVAGPIAFEATDLSGKYKNTLPDGTSFNLDNFTRLSEDVLAKAKVASEAREAQSLAHDEIMARGKELETLQGELDKLKTEVTELETKVKADETAKPELEAKQADFKTKEAEVETAKSGLAEAKASFNDATAARANADQAVVGPRAELLEIMNGFVKRAKAQEDIALDTRKRANASLDEAKANLGLSVRDARDELMGKQETIIDDLALEVHNRTLLYQARSTYRKKLAGIIADITTDEAAVNKKLEEAKADLARIDTAISERRSDYIEGMWLGKRWLEWPILDAFNSPLKIENKWSDDLVQDFNFSKVRRFDRCTTCHQAIDKTMPGSAVEPAYEMQNEIQLTLALPRDDEGKVSIDDLGTQGDEELFERIFGVRLEAMGLLNRNDVTVSFVRPQNRGAEAKQAVAVEAQTKMDGEKLLARMLQPGPWPIQTETGSSAITKTGLMVGDVITQVEGDRMDNRGRIITRLLDAARDKKRTSIVVTVRRGLPHPYASHPRLDLFVGSMSPHKMSDFACTICHDGQGSATAFKWASHTPDSPEQRRQWMKDYGWFDNHHWIYPMNAKRFVEASCLKCHHDVTELKASERFPQTPAPTLTKGHHIIQKYGCFGCHEVNGYDGPNKRVGPDLRLEPQFYAAAQQLMRDPGFSKLSPRNQQIAATLVQSPERDGLRRELYASLVRDGDLDSPVLTKDTHTRIVPLLKDVEAPGAMRKSGPALRMVDSKLDAAFLYDWIKNPRHFRPSTRMPVFFGNHNHLDPKSKSMAQKMEPMEVFGMMKYLLERSQPFEYEKPAKEVAGDVARGATQFQRQCLACHSHSKFADIAKYRDPNQVQQGPDLTGIVDKLNNEKGKQWLYTWIKNPTKYHPRTVMPDLFLDIVETKDKDGKVTVTDPIADIIAFLLQREEGAEEWHPDHPITDIANSAELQDDLNDLVEKHLLDSFYETDAARYLANGIPKELESGLKSIDKELLVNDSDNAESLLNKKIMYVGRKSIAKYGCYGCHDIPGFEDSKPIGAALAEWGRKESSKLAFEHIMQYMELGHGHAGHGNGGGGHAHDDEHEHEAEEGHGVAGPREHLPEYYHQQIHAHNRIGFIYQKLTEPRAYDYHKAGLKKYNEWLKMPQFPFTQEEREAVMTFVLGLVAEPPREKYLYRPSPRQQAIQEGRRVLEKFNCAGCHIIDPERWSIAYPEGHFGPQPDKPVFPFTLHQFAPEDLKKAAEADHRNQIYSQLVGMPKLGDNGAAIVIDDLGDPVEGGLNYDPTKMEYVFDLWEPAIIDGSTYQVGPGALRIPARFLQSRKSVWGGDLARYLLTHVVADEKKVNPNAKGSEAWGWLPPPLIGEGKKVQPGWLHNFLLNPMPIRPATVLRMPKFNMSSHEATQLVNFFAARDNVGYPYNYDPRQQRGHVNDAETQYTSAGAANGDKRSRLDSAMRIVTDQNYCIKCHIVGDFAPTSSDRAKAPDLSVVYSRLRTAYVREWVANPTSKLSYTAMPIVIEYKPGQPNDGGVPQKLFHGSSVDQLDAVVDLLMNYDKYTKRKTLIRPLVEAAAKEAAATKPADAAGGEP